MKIKNRKKRLDKRIANWEKIKDKGGKSGNLAFHKPGSYNK